VGADLGPPGPVPALHRRSEVRSIFVLTVGVAVLGWVFIRQLPENEADADTSRASRPQEIQSVALDGHSLPMAQLREELSTHAGELIDGAKLRHDRTKLEHVLVGAGYLSAHVEPAQVMFDAGGGAFVTFAIAQGRLFHVRSVEITGASERDAGIVTIVPGEVVDAARIERARDAMAERLAVRARLAGHAALGTVAVKLAPDEATASVDVVFAAQ
jgi:Surface antigen variable number repeat